MQQRRFGNSDLVCSALGFGNWELSTTQCGAIDVAEASRAVGAAIDRGTTLFVTAEVYGPYHSEELFLLPLLALYCGACPNAPGGRLHAHL